MNLEKTYYAPRGHEDRIAALHVRHARPDGRYDVSPAAGGWVKVVPAEAFGIHFIEVPRASVEAMLSAFRAVALTYADEGEDFIPGYVNGERWNGWLLPLFTREALLSSQESGLLSGQSYYMQIVPDSESDDLFMVRSTGASLEGAWSADDFAKVLPDGDYLSKPTGDGNEEEIWRLRPTTITVDGEDVVVYDTSGIGWTWMELPAPEEIPAGPHH